MGLLDIMGDSWEDPRTAATLQLAAGLLSDRNPLRGGIAGANGYMQAMAAAKKAKQDEEERRMRLAMQQTQLQTALAQAEQQRAEQARARAVEDAYRGALRTPEQAAMARNGGPTNAAAAAAPGMAPQLDQQALLRSLAQADPVAAAKMLNQQPDYKVVGGSLVAVGPGGKVSEAYRAPDKPEAPPASVREFEYAQQNPAFNQWDRDRRRASAQNITLPKIDLKLGEGVAAQVGPMAKASREQAMSGIRLVDSASRILDAAERGNLYAGPLANLQLKTAQVADVLGIAGKDTVEKITNTRNVIRGMAEQAVQARSQLGGQAQISNSEQELLNKATAGDIGELTAREVTQIAALNDRLGRQLYSLHGQMLQNLGAQPETAGLARFYKVPDLPPPRTPKAPQSLDDVLKLYLNPGQ